MLDDKFQDCTLHTSAFLISSFSVFFGGLMIIFAWRMLSFYLDQNQFFKRKDNLMLQTFIRIMKKLEAIILMKAVKTKVEMMLSAQNFMGRVLVIMVFLMSVGSVVIYFFISRFPLEYCEHSHEVTLIVDMSFNVFFLFYFGLRFIAAENKLKFWIDLNSIVDFFTIPPLCVSLYLKRKWLGLRFLRALSLLELPNILQFLKVTRSYNSIKLTSMVAVFLSVWLTAAGFIHLVENSGDPWAVTPNSQNVSYFDCVYLMMVTMSTVGYGDISSKTVIGRVFMVFYIFGGFALFANYVPEIVKMAGRHNKYDGSYMRTQGRKHIIVCGHLTLESVSAFLNDFFHKNQGKCETEVLFMEEIDPSLELEAIFKINFMKTVFFYGSVLNSQDLLRVKVATAEACLILTNKYCSNPDAEDASNIMRVISIKTFYPAARVIIQVLQSRNKNYLQNIPSWDWTTGDSIICLAELKLGFMAQSCVVPGLSTLLTSLFMIKEGVKAIKYKWQRQFLEGVNHTIVTQYLSDDFIGMSYPEICQICFRKLNLILIAVEFRSDNEENSSILVNPSAQIILQENTLGFFIAKSAAEVKRARYYCKTCHISTDSRSKPITICRCKDPLRSPSRQVSAELFPHKSITSASSIRLVKSRSFGVLSTYIRPVTRPMEWTDEPVLDSTGMFHWCRPVPLQQAVLTRRMAQKLNLRDHIVVGIIGEISSTLIGLQNFVMPLRTSNYTYQELKHIVFIGSLDYMKREWETIHNFPKLLVLPGCAQSCADLRAVGAHCCSMCAILTSNWRSTDSYYLEDTDSILATLNIQSMHLRDSAIIADPFRRWRAEESQVPESHRRIPVITELKNTSNIQFIEQIGELSARDTKRTLYMTTSFATGSVFSGSFLDSLMSTTYFNYQILALFQTLVTGGTTPELEEQLAEENKLKHSKNAAFAGSRDRAG
ncbi:calcium-activated potassium channel subunit alpha-1-like [Rhinatrema bivittatum]|uniref:calcium-activated potassium channel subunit alpha-1-like n=1 Tax=Rhinatrema bivittatum TaxID=194408 RepID=UPI00112CFFEB|nr:calcium-activated potassium channel subunit alpha-1-like [Rhinatrema bivittatum]